MSLFFAIATGAVIVGLGVTALCTIVRIVRGPTLLDRMIASDVLLTTLMLTVGADMVLRGHTDSIALMTAIAATAVLATIIVARYVQRPGGVVAESRPDTHTAALVTPMPLPDQQTATLNRSGRQSDSDAELQSRIQRGEGTDRPTLAGGTGAPTEPTEGASHA